MKRKSGVLVAVGLREKDAEAKETSLYHASRLFFWFILYSFLGWAWETVYCYLTEGVLQDRGILNGPICPIYGFGALIVLFLLDDVFNPIALFLSAGVLTCTLEYLTSYALEALFHVKLWDYSDQPFNIDGRISLLGFLAFGGAATFFKFVFQPAVERWTNRFPAKFLEIVTIIFFVMFIVDIAVTLLGLLGVNPALAHFDEAVGK
ncbi:MAG: putative ABC transporter permease [Bifidobacteriaceae bacterium]|jgi:uncharacterized membrane protein|nr:putative ABC transporter permease [Bifidobacteriaceae bacterium]